MNDLKRLIDVAFLSLIPLTVLSIIFGIASESLTIITVSIDSGLSLIVNFFAFYSIRIVLNQNVFMFPYGTGKLENFSSFLYGTLMIPTSIFIIYFAFYRFFNPPSVIKFGLTQASSIPQFIRSLLLFLWTIKLMKKGETESPMLHSYHINFKVTLFSDIGIIIALAAAYILNALNLKTIAYALDPSFSCLIGLYMLYCGTHLLIHNFKSLINLPLPEEDQFKIMKVLTSNFDAYENIGNLYTNRSGETRFIEVELFLKEDTTFQGIMELRESLEKGLQEQFSDVRFLLIPLQHSKEQN